MKIRKAKYRVKFSICCIVALVCASGVLYSGYKIIEWLIDSQSTKSISTEAEKTAEVEEIADSENTEIIESEEPEESPYWKFINMSLLNVNLEELRKTNPDVRGWIKVGGTNINYPFMQTGDNDYYLSHSLDRSYNSAGWVFADFRLRLDNTDKNTIIYAHGRYDGTMFGTLRTAETNGWLNDPSNYIVYTVTDNETSMWQVFSTYHILTTSDYIRTSFSNNNDFEDFVQMLKNRSSHDFKTNVTGSDHILTLSTCYSDSERMVLHAKLIKRAPR